MLKKNSKKNKENNGTKRYLGVLQEYYRENLKTIRDGFEVVNIKLDSNSKKLDSHTEMIASLMENIEIIKMDIAFLKGALKQKVDYDEFRVLERRLSLVESKLRR
ncbi:hypothetical protein A3I25_01470 [Candidatus Nomurabacteria bacterium RIFCSPLOWO2_02_FULL_42_17]|uniref:Uncharacterized protein n=2 Tax=Candidatus Nomuraibacteriota TaxID=1752729 RepID=A0A1F6WLQ3_9BACT|nr:MAG: hypothetical protein UV08_C0008G0008 [Parcubacteria group bacterium GW2011_GWA2_42_18]OGI82831.1 MAG: hypothetical protein A3B93_00295 [Candidatus Nomurabacteria bacterium RIFCSPHIGHO2_02_FULL_42_24]OGI96808.1 MAG: hypothetical protein A3I25_01470 [Candidatus Nomurabacteria bacterium RIFCSPLOWO2_02_FULL_42_17]